MTWIKMINCDAVDNVTCFLALKGLTYYFSFRPVVNTNESMVSNFDIK